MTIESILVKSSSLDLFVKSVNDSLAGRELGKIVSVHLKGLTLTVHFQKLGSSEICYEFEQKVLLQTQTFEGKLTREKIALTHRAFRSEIEKKLAKVLRACGAEIQGP